METEKFTKMYHQNKNQTKTLEKNIPVKLTTRDLIKNSKYHKVDYQITMDFLRGKIRTMEDFLAENDLTEAWELHQMELAVRGRE